MLNIVLFCGAGMSTSLLANKIKEAADQQGIETTVEAYPMSEVEKIGPTADIILIGPQIRHKIAAVKAAAPNVPTQAIDMSAYGMVDGEKVLADALKLYNESK